MLVLVDHHKQKVEAFCSETPVFFYEGSHNIFRSQNFVRISCYHATQTEFANMLSNVISLFEFFSPYSCHLARDLTILPSKDELYFFFFEQPCPRVEVFIVYRS